MARLERSLQEQIVWNAVGYTNTVNEHTEIKVSTLNLVPTHPSHSDNKTVDKLLVSLRLILAFLLKSKTRTICLNL